MGKINSSFDHNKYSHDNAITYGLWDSQILFRIILGIWVISLPVMIKEVQAMSEPDQFFYIIATLILVPIFSLILAFERR